MHSNAFHKNVKEWTWDKMHQLFLTLTSELNWMSLNVFETVFFVPKNEFETLWDTLNQLFLKQVSWSGKEEKRMHSNENKLK